MKTSYKLLIGFGIAHLIISIMGCYRLNPFGDGVMGKMFYNYQAYTGANGNFEFFAPNVSGIVRTMFDIEYADGRKESKSFAYDDVNSETRLRMGNIFTSFWDSENDKDVRRSLAASWASTLMARNPGSQKITVRVQEFDLPPMDLYREGVRSKWYDAYSATFVR